MRLEGIACKCREDPPLEVTVATVVAERQASAGARDGVKGQRRTLAARAPLHALVRPRTRLGSIVEVDAFVRRRTHRGDQCSPNIELDYTLVANWFAVGKHERVWDTFLQEVASG